MKRRLPLWFVMCSVAAAAPGMAQTPPAPAPGTAVPVVAPHPPQPAPAAVGEGAESTKPKAPKKPLVALVLPDTKRVPGYEHVRVYESPVLDPEPQPEPTEVKAIEITEPVEALVLARPYYPSPLVGAINNGARVPIRGVVHAKSARGCAPRTWYAVSPFGYVCAKGGRPTSQPADAESILKVPSGERVPFRYVMVMVKEGEKIPMWATLEDARNGKDPERQLEHGDSVAVERRVNLDGTPAWISVEGKVFPAKGTAEVGNISEWKGEALDDKTVFPFGWITPDKAKVYGTADAKGKPVDNIDRRARVTVAEEAGTGKTRMLRIGEGRWVRAGDVNEVRKLVRPPGITAAKQWVDVDLGEQVLVAYEGENPVYATLTSSGRAIPTPRGNYPVWSHVTSISMKSQPYEDKAYFVNKVPWVLFFQAHNAIHGAYWHDRFGVSKSHGCVNVSPLDARHLFEWMEPALPPGWTGYRTEDLLHAPTVHVRNSHDKIELVQERPIGPPDKELEAQKMEAAEERRAATSAVPGATTPSNGGAAAGAGLQP